MKFVRPSCSSELGHWFNHYAKYSRLAWLKVIWSKPGKKSVLFLHPNQGVVHTNFQTNQSDIFSIENDGEAGGSSHKAEASKNHPLNPMQHAYLKDRLTETALHDLVYKRLMNRWLRESLHLVSSLI
jgi:hypothetical protein